MSERNPTNKILSPAALAILQTLREESTLSELCTLFHPLTQITIQRALEGYELRKATRQILETRLLEINRQRIEAKRARAKA